MNLNERINHTNDTGMLLKINDEIVNIQHQLNVNGNMEAEIQRLESLRFFIRSKISYILDNGRDNLSN